MSNNKEISVLDHFSEIDKLAHSIASSGLFGIKTKDQAIALMAIAQAEGLHPATAAIEYDIIQGKPSLKAGAILSRFQKAGGKVEWNHYTDEKVAATFSHPQGGSVSIEWDMARALKAGLASKDNWKKWPRSMLRSRVISEGVRTVYPGSTNNLYTPDEVEEFNPHEKKIPFKLPVPIENPEFEDNQKNRIILFNKVAQVATSFNLKVENESILIKKICREVLEKKPLTEKLDEIINETFIEKIAERVGESNENGSSENV